MTSHAVEEWRQLSAEKGALRQSTFETLICTYHMMNTCTKVAQGALKGGAWSFFTVLLDMALTGHLVVVTHNASRERLQ
jgi:hypothetical protein